MKIRVAPFLGSFLAAALAATVFVGCEDVAGNTSKAGETEKTATPAANPAAGVVPYGTAVALSSATEGAAIYYTLDGEDPDGRSALYTAPLTVTADVTIKAIAVKAGLEASGVLEAAYTLDMTRAVSPTATPEAGAIGWGTRVVLASVTEGAKIYYTLDGSDPDRDSTEYTGETAITITGEVTVKAIAVKEGMTDSALLTAAYALLPFEQAAAPVADPPGGGVVSGTAVTLSSATEGAKIYYTIDGSDPDDTSEEYAGEIPVIGAVNETITINAVAVKPGMDPSGILRAVYTIEEPGAVADIAVDPGTGAIPLNGQVALTTGTPGARIYYRLNADAATAVTADNGTLYTEPFVITESVSIRAVAVKEGWTASRELRIVVQPGLSCFNYDSVSSPLGSSGTISDIAWGTGVYVATKTGNPNAAWSADGRNWIVVSDIGAGNFGKVGYGGGKFVALGTKPATSPDGKTWTVIEDSGYISGFNCLVYDGPESGKLFIAGGTNKIYTSPDGEHWTARPIKDNYGYDRSGDVNSIIYLGDRWVAVGGNKFFATSTDNGATWIRKTPFVTAGFSSSIYQVIYDGSQVIGVGSSGQIGFSQADTVAEVQWAVRKGGTGEENTGFATNTTIWGIVYFTAHGAAHYLAVGKGGMAYSTNGRAWRAVNAGSILGSSGSFTGVRWYNGKLFLWSSGQVFIWEP